MKKLKDEHKGDALSSYEPDLLVIHDMGADFRALDWTSESNLLQPVADKHKAPWLIWHMHHPLAQGTLWEALRKDKAEKEKDKKGKEAILERTILVVKIECVRRLGVNIADNLSLEKEALDFFGSMDANSDLRDLCAARHLVVHFHGEGVWHYDKKNERLIPYYCPAANAKTKLTDPALGMMVGYTTLLTAAIVRGLTWRLKELKDCKDDDKREKAILAGRRDGIQQGVILDHLYFRKGYADYGFNNQDEYKKNRIIPRPFAKLFDLLNDEDEAIQHARGPDWEEYRLADLDHIHRDTRSLNHWSRIEGFFENTRHPKANDDKIRSSEEVAIEIVLQGLEAVVTAPIDNKDTKDGDRTPGTPSMTIKMSLLGVRKDQNGGST